MSAYQCINCYGSNLSEQPDKLECEGCNAVFPKIDKFVDFSIADSEKVDQRVKYNDGIVDRYQNFLQWLHLTFQTNDYDLRRNIFQGVEVAADANVLIVGVGLGHDVDFLINQEGRHDLRVHCQDLSLEMLAEARKLFAQRNISICEMNCSNASNLPYVDNYFDFVFHFGGINYFQDRIRAINEMNRVARPGAQIVIGDESVAPWLRGTDFGQMMIVNNPLWRAEPPINEIPSNANFVSLKYILENCFYLLSWRKDLTFPKVNLDVEHIGPRGGQSENVMQAGLKELTQSPR